MAIETIAFVSGRTPSAQHHTGQEFSGKIEAIGQSFTLFKVGDAVVGTTEPSLSGHAEYITISAQSDEGVLTIKPDSVSFEESTTVPVSSNLAFSQ